jgi:hypothetical protein
MKRTLIAVFAVLALAFANPSATSADKPDNPGNSQSSNAKDKDSCKKKSCGQPHGQSCKHANVHKTWCNKDRDRDDDGDDDDDNDNDNSTALANTGA